MKSSVHVYVDPACDFLYASFYIHGLRQLFTSLSYSSRYFKSFKHNNCHFAFVLRRGKSVFKGLIDFGDSYEIDAKALEWCDNGKKRFMRKGIQNHSFRYSPTFSN